MPFGRRRTGREQPVSRGSDVAHQDQEPDRRSQPAIERDLVDRIIDRWREERPDLDPSAKAVTGRIVRLGGLLQHHFSEDFAGEGIDDGCFAVLAALRRAGAPYELSPKQLNKELLISSGGVTHLVDRLERRSLVTRRPAAADRRSVLVALTPDGVACADRAMTAHARTEQLLVSGLGPGEREQLARLLRKLLLSLDLPVSD
jgi:DNA-binding MarR family transcriptional regulator